MEISVKDYAEQFKLSLQAVYKRIKKGQLKTIKNKDGKVLILLEETELNQSEKNLELSLTQDIDILELKIKHLEDVLEREKSEREKSEKDKEALNKRLDTAENEKRELLERNREQNHLLLQSVKNNEMLTVQLKELEYKKEEQEEKKGFWKKVFGENK